MTTKMSASRLGIKFIQRQESFTPVIKSDRGKPMIGWGCELTPDLVQLYQNRTIIPEDSETLMLVRVIGFEAAIN